jgi:sulfatase maturation enzyme AslB (radical SAM superfamily)
VFVTVPLLCWSLSTNSGVCDQYSAEHSMCHVFVAYGKFAHYAPFLRSRCNMRLLIGSAAKRARDTMDTDDDQDYTEQQQQQDEEVRACSVPSLCMQFSPRLCALWWLRTICAPE